jgi:hypothetical protein
VVFINTLQRRTRALVRLSGAAERPVVTAPDPWRLANRRRRSTVVTLQNEHLQELSDICAHLESQAAVSPTRDPAEVLQRASARWAELGGAADDALTQRFEAAAAALRQGWAGASAPAPVPDAEAPKASAEEVSTPVAAVAAASEHGAGAISETAGPAVAVLSPDERAARLTQVVQMLNGAEQLLSASDLPDARARWTALRREWAALIVGIDLADDVAARLKGLEARIDGREAELRESRARQQHENLSRLQHLCGQLEKIAQTDQVALKDTERALREARAALDAPGPLPSRQDQQAIVARLKSVQSLLFPRVQDLREADEWERWANAGVQETLLKRLEGLREEPDVAAVAKQLRVVQDEWHKVRAVPREKGRELWQRYKTVEGELRARCEDHFQHMAVERAENLRLKEGLCEQAEALTESIDWIRTAETIKGLQAQWKTLGPVTPGHEKAIWERFRAACDHFFTRRKHDLADRKTVWTANLQKKEALCAQIEVLAETTDWDRALVDVKRVQNDWRTVGPVKRSRADAILLRFRGACEKFFENYAHRNERETAQQAQAREQIIAQLEALVPSAGQGEEAPAPETVVKDVLALKRQWDQSPGLAREQSEPLAARYGAALAAILAAHAAAFAGTELDADQNRKRLEQLCQTVEALAGDDKTPANLSPAAILATQWREALAANTIGGGPTMRPGGGTPPKKSRRPRPAGEGWARCQTRPVTS